MKSPSQLQQWLSWIIKIRFVIITFVFAIDFSLRQLLGQPASSTYIKPFAMAIILWYVLGLFYLIYNQLSRPSASSLCSDLRRYHSDHSNRSYHWQPGEQLYSALLSGCDHGERGVVTFP